VKVKGNNNAKNIKRKKQEVEINVFFPAKKLLKLSAW
jgi:hypothetical protein